MYKLQIVICLCVKFYLVSVWRVPASDTSAIYQDSNHDDNVNGQQQQQCEWVQHQAVVTVRVAAAAATAAATANT